MMPAGAVGDAIHPGGAFVGRFAQQHIEGSGSGRIADVKNIVARAVCLSFGKEVLGAACSCGFEIQADGKIFPVELIFHRPQQPHGIGAAQLNGVGAHTASVGWRAGHKPPVGGIAGSIFCRVFKSVIAHQADIGLGAGDECAHYQKNRKYCSHARQNWLLPVLRAVNARRQTQARGGYFFTRTNYPDRPCPAAA